MSTNPPPRSESSYADAGSPSQQHQSPHSDGDDSSDSPLVLYRPPTVVSLLRTAAINLVLPFINGLMLGFGELFAHEIAFRLGWGGTRVFPLHRASRPVGPGIEVREQRRRRTQQDQLADLTSLE